MELCLVIPIIGLFIIALSIVFFLLAFTSTTCFRKLTNHNLFYLYCLFLFVIGISILLVSVSPENEKNLIEKLKIVIYNLDEYSPCKDKKEDDDDENNKDFDVDDKNNYNKSIENETNIDYNDSNKYYDNNLNDSSKYYDNNLNDSNKYYDNNLNDSNKYYDNNFEKNKDEDMNNSEYNNDYNFIEHKDIQDSKNELHNYKVSNFAFTGKFFVFNFCKFWIKFANFLRFIGRKSINFVYKDRNIKE